MSLVYQINYLFSVTDNLH